MKKKTKVIYSGLVRKDIEGQWDDVARGIWIGEDCLGETTADFLWYDYKGKNIKITIEELD